MCVYDYEWMCVGIRRSQKRVLDFLELESQAAVNCLIWVLGIEPGIAVKAASVLPYHFLQPPKSMVFWYKNVGLGWPQLWKISDSPLLAVPFRIKSHWEKMTLISSWRKVTSPWPMEIAPWQPMALQAPTQPPQVSSVVGEQKAALRKCLRETWEWETRRFPAGEPPSCFHCRKMHDLPVNPEGSGRLS